MKLSLFVGSMDGGGAERQMLLLASALSRRGHDVDLILLIKRGPYLAQVPASINLVVLEYSGIRTLIAALARYLRKVQPSAMITAMPQPNGYAIWARLLTGGRTKLVLTERNPRSDVLDFNRHFIENGFLSKGYVKFALIRHSYRFADAIVGISKGVAARLQELPGVQRDQVRTVYNGVDLSSVATQSAASVADPWPEDDSIPVILGVGRLEKVKDFSTLIAAFNLVKNIKPARLMILGEGSERPHLEHLVTELGLTDLVRLPGFFINPYTYMARASVFVLSSQHEGFGNVIVEALACGTPVVSTDCPSGPREILDDGRYGRLVLVGDVEALARAMIETLDNPPPPESLKERAREFSIEACADAYLKLMSEIKSDVAAKEQDN